MAQASLRAPRDKSLKPVTVQLDDLPDGWALEPADRSEEESVQFVCNVKLSKPLGKHEVAYSAGGPFGAYVSSAAYRLPKGTAKPYMDAVVRSLAGTCPDSRAEGNEVSSYTPMKMAKFADQSWAVRIHSKQPGGIEISADMVYMRHGDIIAGVITVSLGSPTPSISTLAKKIATRLAKIR